MNENPLALYAHVAKGGPVALLEQTLTIEKFILENEILENLHVIGGPTNVREWFVESSDEIDSNDILY